MTDLELRLACQAIVSTIREQERARLIAEAERIVYGSDWFQSGVKQARLRLVEKPKRARLNQRRDGKLTNVQRCLSMLPNRRLTAADISAFTSIPVAVVRTIMTRLHAVGRVVRDGSRPALYSLPTEAE